MAIDSGDLVGGGGGIFKTTFHDSTSIGSGQSGIFITLTPPSEQRVSLDLLNSFTAETNIRIIIGGTTVITSTLQTASIPVSSGNFKIQSSGDQEASIAVMKGLVDEVIQVEKVSGSTGDTINFAFSYEAPS